MPQRYYSYILSLIKHLIFVSLVSMLLSCYSMLLLLLLLLILIFYKMIQHTFYPEGILRDILILVMVFCYILAVGLIFHVTYLYMVLPSSSLTFFK